MNYVPFVPEEAPLAGAVDLIFCLEGYEPEHRLERLVPDGRVNLVIALDDRDRHVFDNDTGDVLQTCRHAWLSGIHSRHLTIGETLPTNRLAVVQFALGRALGLLHEPLSSLNDRVVPAAEVFGPGILEAREEWQALAAEAVPAAIAAWLAPRWRADLAPPPILTPTLDRLRASPAEVQFTRLVEEDGSVSYRHFVELFKRHVGPTPKSLQRILRFHRVFEALQANENVRWADLSHELGYADQAHFIRDFVEFSGFRPREFQARDHDRTNFFPEP